MRKVFFCLFIYFVTAPQIQAQTAAISGTVLDPEGKVVPNASVVATSESTHAPQTLPSKLAPLTGRSGGEVIGWRWPKGSTG